MQPAAYLNIIVNANTSSASANLTKLDAQLKGTSRSANTTSAAIGSKLATSAKYGAVGVALIGAASVKMAADFEKSMRNVNSIAQLPEKQFARLEDRVKGLAGKTAQAPKTLAEGLYDLVSSGFKANESIQILHASARAATAGLTDTATSTKAVAAVLNAYHKPASAAKKVSDELFATVNYGVVTFEDLANTIGDTLPFASQLGVKLNEIGASTATMTKQGLSSAETMTRIRNVMQALIKPSSDLNDVFKGLNMTGEDLIQKYGFQGALEKIVATTDGTKEAVAKLFPNIRALGGVLALTGKNASSAEADLRRMQDTAGATNTVLAQQSKSVAYQWQKLKAQVSVLAIDIGDKLLPVVNDVLRALNEPGKSKFLTQLLDSFKALAKGVSDVWNQALKPIIGAILPAFAKMQKGVLEGFRGFIDIFAGLLTLDFGRAFDGAKEVIGGFWDWMKGGIGTVTAAIKTPILLLAHALTKPIQAAFSALKSAVTFAMDKVLGVVSSALGAIGDMASKFDGIPILGDKFAGLGHAAHGAQQDIDSFRERLRGDDAETAKRKALEKVQDGFTALSKVIGSSGKDFDGWTRRTKQDLALGADNAQAFRDKAHSAFATVADIIHGLDSATGKGLGNIGSNLNSILKGMKVGEVKFSIKQAAKSGLNAINSVVNRQGGGMVPGTGSGDKVPLHIGGQLAAMVEPGEYVSVANRNATAALMQANKAVPRFADGGVVPAVSQAIKLVTGKFPGLSVTSTTGGGHAAGSYHYQGKAVDLASGDTGYMDKAAAWIKTAIGKYLLEGIHNPNLSISNGQSVSPSFWGAATWADHIDHIHLALDSLGKVMGAASKIKRQILSGPAGPLTDMGQSILDRARTAADNFISKHSPGVGDSGVGVTLYKGPLDKTFPSFYYANGTGGQPQLSPDQVRGLANKAGLPGSTFEKIAHGESNYYPGAISSDGGYGLWQMTPRVQSAETVNAWHKIGSYFNPWRNALMAKYLYDRASSKTPNTPGFPWYGTRYLQKGGLVPHLKGGGKPKNSFNPHIVGPPQGFTNTPGALVPENIDKLFDRISKIKHRIAKLTESISIFDQFAQVDGLFTDAERNTEVDQNVRLLKMQREIVALATKGENTLAGPIKHAKGNAGSKLKRLRNRFHGDITQMTGLTGKSGDIAQTQLTLYGLLHPDSSSTNASDLAALQLAIANDTIKRLSVQVAQAPVFSQFFAGAFKNGGSIPAGKWGLVGEAGPEIVSGPAQVTSTSATQQVLSPAAPHIENHIYIDPVSLETRVETYVDRKLNKEGRNMLNRLPAGGPVR